MSENASPDPSIEGLWQMVRAELGGEKAPEMVVEKTQLELKDGHYAVWFAGEVTDRGTYELGSTKGAKTIVLNGTEGQNSGRTIPCIYQLTGHRIRIGYGLNGITPATITSPAGRTQYLATYRKAQSNYQTSHKDTIDAQKSQSHFSGQKLMAPR